MKEGVVKNYKEGFNQYQKLKNVNYDHQYVPLTSTWDNIQQMRQCCGVESSDDLINTNFEQGNQSAQSDSCCADLGSRMKLSNYTCWSSLSDKDSKDSNVY